MKTKFTFALMIAMMMAIGACSSAPGPETSATEPARAPSESQSSGAAADTSNTTAGNARQIMNDANSAANYGDWLVGQGAWDPQNGALDCASAVAALHAAIYAATRQCGEALVAPETVIVPVLCAVALGQVAYQTYRVTSQCKQR